MYYRVVILRILVVAWPLQSQTTQAALVSVLNNKKCPLEKLSVWLLKSASNSAPTVFICFCITPT